MSGSKKLHSFLLGILILYSPNAVGQNSVEQRLDRIEAKVDTLLSYQRPKPITEIAANVINDSLNLFWGIAGPRGTILDKGYFVINENDSWKIPYWVGYYTSASLLAGETQRTDDFRPDPELPKGKRSELADYKNSGFDRGHNAPAGDFQRSRAAMSTTFLLSNMCPQTSKLNRSIWEKLEAEVRQAVTTEGEGWVVVGSVFLDSDSNLVAPSKFIGADSVAVPTHCFKVLLLRSHGSSYIAYAFLLPNQKNTIKGIPADYEISVDRLEAITGYDFFPKLDDAIENQIEASLPVWPR